MSLAPKKSQHSLGRLPSGSGKNTPEAEKKRRALEATRMAKRQLKLRRKLSPGAKLFLALLVASFCFFILLLCMTYIHGLKQFAFNLINSMIN